MKKNNQSKEYGKPYSPKEYRQVGIGMFIVGIIIVVFGASVYQSGLVDQIILTKGGNEIHGADPGNPLYLIIGIFGGILSIVGVFLWIRGKKK